MKIVSRFSVYGKSFLYTLAISLFLFHQMVPLPTIGIVLSVVSILVIVVSLGSSDGFTKIMSVLFLAFGTWLVIRKGIDWLSYVALYGEMLYLLSLFAIVPLLSIPIRAGGYRDAFEQLFQRKVTSISQLYRVVTSISYLLGSFLNMAAIPIVHSSIQSAVEAWPIGKPKRFLAGGIIQGYSLPIMWTPLSGVVGVVLYVLKVRWLYIFPVLFFISIVALVFNWIVFSLMESRGQNRIGREESAAAEENPASDQNHRIRTMLLQVLLTILLFLSMIVSVDALFSIGLVVSVILLTVPFAWVWCLFLKKGRAFWAETKQHFTEKIAGMKESFAIFLSAGFFVQALHYSGSDHFVNHLFVQLKDLVGTRLFLFFIPYMTLLLSFIGLHPIVVVNLLAQSLKTEVLGITPERMAVAFLGGAVMTFYMGPFSGTLGLMSSMIGEAPMRIASWSFVYAIGFSIILTIVNLLF